MNDANTYIAPVLGISPLPYVEFTSASSNRNYKLDDIKKYLTKHSSGEHKIDIPFVWFDDDFYEEDSLWLNQHMDAPVKLILTDPITGWTLEDKQEAIDFLTNVVK